MRRLWTVVVVAGCLLVAPGAAGKDIENKFGLGGMINSTGLAGVQMCFSAVPVNIEFALDFDLQKLAGVDDPTVQFGFGVGTFVKAIRYEFVNAGPQFHFVGGIYRAGTADPIFHPLLQVGFRAEWFPEGNNHFAFQSAVNLVVDIPTEYGPVLNPSTGLAPGSEGVGIGIAPNASAGFLFYF